MKICSVLCSQILVICCMKKQAMEKHYEVSGMTCDSCVANVKKGVSTLQDIKILNVQLEKPQLSLRMSRAIPIEDLQAVIGHYEIKEATTNIEPPLITENEVPDISFSTYKPLLLIIGFLIGTTLLAQYPFQNFSWQLWMRHFMAGFFLVFSFFKLLNVEGFAQSYQMYDILATRWKTWGYIYPFVELGLGVLYLINIAPFFTNLATIIILGFSSIGVIKSNLDKRKIKCACLGDVFNLPMSTVTIIEDLTMIAMAGLMLWQL